MKELSNRFLRLKIECLNGYTERVLIAKEAGGWAEALECAPYATLPADENYFDRFGLLKTSCSVEISECRAIATLQHPDHTIVRTLTLDEESPALNVEVSLTAKRPLALCSVEDKWFFLPERRDQDDEMTGPIDFVWSQRIKSFPVSIIPHYSFRFPAVMMQQGPVFAALVAGLEGVGGESLARCPLGMDLDVTREAHPFMSYGAIVPDKVLPNYPCEPGHAQIVRGKGARNCVIRLEAGETLRYHYSILASAQPEKQGYRSAVRYVWRRYGEKEINNPGNRPECERHPEAKTVADWEKIVWEGVADRDFFSYNKGGVTVGGISGHRQGEWFSRTKTDQDLWFGCWLNELVSGYGLSLYADKIRSEKWRARLQPILNAILNAPRSGALFPIICYHETDGSDTWLNDDGWAGFFSEYHALMMSWTGYLMLQWGKHVLPERMPDILAFLRPYAGFLLSAQRPDGCIPAWFDGKGRPSRKQFREFNAETAVSALFLLEIGDIEKNPGWVEAGAKSLGFITEKVLPRMRWFDLEAFLSCSRKQFDFYDTITAQYPQCNLSQMYAAMAYLKYYKLTGRPEDLRMAERVTDYLLLTQQVWRHPEITANTFGGFTVQNTDNEWSDVREGLIAVLLHRMYLATGKREYLERAVAASKSGFAVLPYENWAHNGYEGLQYDSSVLWGGGVILTSAEYLEREIGDLFVDAEGQWGLGTHGALVERVTLQGDALAVEAAIARRDRETLAVTVRAEKSVRLMLNGKDFGPVMPNVKSIFKV